MGGVWRRASTSTGSRPDRSRRRAASSTFGKPVAALFAATVALFPSGAPAADKVDDEARIRLDFLEAGFERLDRDFALEEWNYYTRGEPGRIETFREVMASVYGDEALFERLGRYRTEVSDPETARRAELLHRRCLEEKVPGVREIFTLTDSLSNIQIHYRATLHGEPVTDNDLVKILRFDPDRAKREEAWRARFGVGNRKAQGLVDLVDLRNREARRLGYRDFYDYRMDVIGMKEQELLELLARLRDLSEEPYRAFAAKLRERLGVDRLEPWDLVYAAEPVREEIDRYYPEEAMESRVFASFRDMGLPVDELPIVVDAEPRPGKSQHAYSFPIDAPSDVRILFNADRGLASTHTLLHEMGHSVYSALIEEPYFSFQSPPSKAMSEGVAEFFGVLAEEPAWQARYAGVPEEMIDRYGETRRGEGAYELRRMILYILLEWEMYTNPALDVTDEYWELMRDLFQVDTHEEVAAWAQLIHYTTHPVYYQNYLVGDLIAAHLRHYLRATNGRVVGDPRTGEFFRDRVFRIGARLPWNDLLVETTGEPLNPEHYVTEWLENGKRR